MLQSAHGSSLFSSSIIVIFINFEKLTHLFKPRSESISDPKSDIKSRLNNTGIQDYLAPCLVYGTGGVERV
jgi:hypothetical protein